MGKEELENKEFQIEGAWETSDEAMDAAKDVIGRYDAVYLISPNGRKTKIE